MRYKIIDIILKKNRLFNFDPLNIDWDDETVCALCGKKSECKCNIHLCPCNKDARYCKWPSDSCPCPKCDKLIKNCNCIVYIKKDK